MGHRRVRLPVRAQEEALLMVDEVQLRPLRRTRCRFCIRSHHYFLLVRDPKIASYPYLKCETNIPLTMFSLQYPKNGTIGLNTIQTWWGNTVFTKTGDWNSVALKTVPTGQIFG